MPSGYGQFCPVAVASEIFAERWTPVILRELLAGAQQFNAIHRGVPRISRPLLARRLREFAAAGVVAVEPLPSGHGNRYRLTAAGEELRPVIDALAAWGQKWTARFERGNLDPGLLMWNLRRRFHPERLPERRIVVCVRFSGVPTARRGPRTFWLLVERPEIELCVTDPSYEVDLHVEADLEAMARVWLGDETFERAIRTRAVRLSGPRDLARAFPAWWALSPFAGLPRRGRAAPAESRV